MKPIIYWTEFKHDQWNFYIAATDQGLCFVGSQGESFDELSMWAAKKVKGFVLLDDEEYMKPYAEALKRYFNKETKDLKISLDLYGTDFQKEVWSVLQTIPHGETMTYSEVARLLNKPKAVRAVSTAIGANPVMIVVPCHRVIGKNGSLTGFRGGLDMKERLLALEKGSGKTERAAK
jgi:methylated-DNA-[protein]-cysteine S-methyltransferase